MLINSYRYRSYRYDTETGLYYLNSRYYNPEWGRFINADGYGGQVGELLSHNVYAYCLNNPVNNYDPDGDIALAIPFIAISVKDLLIATVGFVGGVAIGGTIFDNIKDNATSKAKSEPIAKTPNRRTHTVYTLRNEKKIVEYVGRTGRPIEYRKQEHLANPARAHLILQKEAENLTLTQARGLEQILIDKYQTLNRNNLASNQRNGIWLYNPNRSKYIEAASMLLSENETYVGP